MTVHEIQNVTVEEMGNPLIAYRIRTMPGYVLRLPTYDENIYKTVAILDPDYDFSTVQVIAETDLPEGAEIYGSTDNDHEIA